MTREPSIEESTAPSRELLVQSRLSQFAVVAYLVVGLAYLWWRTFHTVNLSAPLVSLPFLAADATTSNFVVGWQGYGNGTDMDLFGRWFQSSSGPHTYCISKTNSQGCTPLIGWTGAPSATDAAPFTITGYQVLNQKLGLLLYGYGSKFTPYQGSQICVAPPLKRLAIQSSGGSASGTDCSGIFTTNFNARIQSGIDPQLVPGKTISARWFYRDPQDPAGFSSGLTNALRFTICP